MRDQHSIGIDMPQRYRFASVLRIRALTSGGAREYRGRQKTDRIDADGSADLLAEDRLPERWIAPRAIREGRELLRARLALVATRTPRKHRMHRLVERDPPTPLLADGFGCPGRQGRAQPSLPPHAQFVLPRPRTRLDQLVPLLGALAARLRAVVACTPKARLLDTWPGVGVLLAMVLA